jgi:subtilase family serine protease
MSLRHTGLAIALATASVSGIGLAQSAHASATWVDTATKAVSLPSATKLGAAPAATKLHLAIGLKPRNTSALNAATHAMYTPGSSTYQHYLTPAQWRAKYAPSAAAVTSVTKYLKAAGFTGVQVAGDHLLVTANATARQAESAFHTSLSRFTAGKLSLYGNTTPAMIPASLRNTINAVIGLDNLPLATAKPAVAKPQAGSPDIEGGLLPAQFDTTYDAKTVGQGAKTSIAILTEGDTTTVIKQLRLAESKEKLPVAPVTVVKVGPQSTDASGADEFDMDSQVSTAVAGKVAHLYMYNIGSLVDSDIDADIAAFASQDKATAMSASIGGCDVNAYLDGSLVATDTILQEAAMQGQTLFASSGDNGDACMYVAALGAPAGVPGTNWPASGEYTTAVGGTSLISDSSGNRIQELGWVGSGGGISEVENPGFWTQDSDPGYNLEDATGGRAVPDISLDADPNVATPAEIYVDGALEGVGGTSLSSPMMLGFWARLESQHGNKLGLASIDLYRLYDKVNPGTTESTPVGNVTVPSVHPAAVPGFTDITVGDNGLYPDLPGYDEVTGLGAPDVAGLNKALK